MPYLLAALLALAASITLTSASSIAAGEKRVVEKNVTDPAADAAAKKTLGGAVPQARADGLSGMLRVGDQSLFSHLEDRSSGGQPRYEASGLLLDLRIPGYEPLRIENARVVLQPSADGRNCRFEIGGAPFGLGSTFEAGGTIEWAAGPFGGDKLDATFRLGDAPVEAVRTAFPERMDPAFHGLLNVAGKASGVVGETTTEEAPATPLRGDFEAGLDFQVLGRLAPLRITSNFQLDDRMLRLQGGHLLWQDFDLGLRGWLDPDPTGEMDLTATFTDIDANKVATEWNVPEPWRPVASVSGAITLKGKPRHALMRYDATAPSVAVPALGGFPVRLTKPKITGSLLAINADLSASFRPEETAVGDISFGNLPWGLQWFREQLMVNAANSKMWGGENDFTLSYKPAEHPVFGINGRLAGADAAIMAATLAPWLGLDVEGTGAISYAFGQDAARTPRWSAHASLATGRIGGVDLFARTFDALAAVDPSLKIADAGTLLPKPRRGAGTRVDRLFTEIERNGDTFLLGGMFLHASEFQLDADGEVSRAGGLRLDGTLKVPAAVVERLVAGAAWMSALRQGDLLFIPVVISGSPSQPNVELAPGYADLLAQAKKGEQVTAPRVKTPRHVGGEGLANIPYDPANPVW